MSQTDHAEIVIVGGGIIGCAIAYHLTRMGKSDVLLLEKSGLTHGATWHAAGLVGQLRSSRNLTRMLQRSVALYDRLEAETGQAHRLEEGRQPAARLLAGARCSSSSAPPPWPRASGWRCSSSRPSEAQRALPDPRCRRRAGSPPICRRDGYVDPASVTQALAKGARMKGARIRQGIAVTGVERNGRRVTGV